MDVSTKSFQHAHHGYSQEQEVHIRLCQNKPAQHKKKSKMNKTKTNLYLNDGIVMTEIAG